MALYRHDEAFRERGFHATAGIDEVGRGPLAGPVVASAVILSSVKKIAGLRDSKKIPERERETLFWEILSNCRDVGIGVVGPETIDRINILKATKLAMEIAVKDLSSIPALLLIDAIKLPSIAAEQVSIIKGDALSASIAAASIVAKVIRDHIMKQYDSIYPQYGFARHKGYPTREHISRISLHGPCLIHRKTFARVLPMQAPNRQEGL